jgi:hypothetical protein
VILVLEYQEGSEFISHTVGIYVDPSKNWNYSTNEKYLFYSRRTLNAMKEYQISRMVNPHGRHGIKVTTASHNEGL